MLDDAPDPLVLSWRLRHPSFHGGNFRVEVVKINFPVANPDNVLEQQLTQEKRAVTYGIYFDFAKATLKPESEPVLKEIAQALKDNPDWNLTVEGHTDNIGGDAYNLDLSKRRALAVEALVAQYNIAPDRLANDGFGASRPVESNDTLEGRARVTAGSSWSANNARRSSLECASQENRRHFPWPRPVPNASPSGEGNLSVHPRRTALSCP